MVKVLVLVVFALNLVGCGVQAPVLIESQGSEAALVPLTEEECSLAIKRAILDGRLEEFADQLDIYSTLIIDDSQKSVTTECRTLARERLTWN